MLGKRTQYVLQAPAIKRFNMQIVILTLNQNNAFCLSYLLLCWMEKSLIVKTNRKCETCRLQNSRLMEKYFSSFAPLTMYLKGFCAQENLVGRRKIQNIFIFKVAKCEPESNIFFSNFCRKNCVRLCALISCFALKSLQFVIGKKHLLF